MLKKIGLSTAALLAAMELVQAPSALAAGRTILGRIVTIRPRMVPGIATMFAIKGTIALRIATTIATFRNLAVFDCAGALSTTPRNRADNNHAGPVTAITMAIAGD